MKNFSGMIAFQVGGVSEGEAVAERMMSDFEVIHYAVSLGHHRSLCFWMATEELMQTSFRLEGAQLGKLAGLRRRRHLPAFRGIGRCRTT